MRKIKRKLRDNKGMGVIEMILMTTMIVVMFLIMASTLTGCEPEAQVVRKEPIRGRYLPAHYETNTTLEHRYDAWNDEMVFVPITKTEYVDDTWEILYEIEFDDGAHAQAWQEVSEEEYNEIEK